MTIALELDEVGTTVLRQEAADLGVTPEELARDIIRQHIRVRAQASLAGTAAGEDAFRQALAASMSENKELLRRLAQ